MSKGSIRIKRALISVSDKQDLVPFARTLRRLDIEIVSTGGTLKALRSAGIKARSISDITDFPEILGGRVKSLHPKIHGGLLFLRDSLHHKKEIKAHGILPIDMVVVNLYPFREVIRSRTTSLEEALENIDIGGPTIVRAAAKNFHSVLVVTDPADYASVSEILRKRKAAFPPTERRRFAQKAYALTSSYDCAIERYLSSGKEKTFPPILCLQSERIEDLRYGENPHQQAALYQPPGGRIKWRQLHGKQLSYNNLLDVDACLAILSEFRASAACVVKHNNPCGIAEHKVLSEALGRALECDPLSSFGGIIGLNRPCDAETARLLLQKLVFFEVVVAPLFEDAALLLLKAKKNVRLIEVSDKVMKASPSCRYNFTRFGVLLQEADDPLCLREKQLRKKLRCVTKRKPTKSDIEKLLFAFRCVKTVRSNAIVLTQGTQTVGIGAGQMSRVDAVVLACMKADRRAAGSFLASDAFFPMADSIEVAACHGIRAIIQPGGSIRDADVIAACNRRGICMVFTGERHFRH